MPIIKKGYFIPCFTCGKDFYITPSQIKTKKYCSKDCMNHNLSGLKPKGIHKNCENCKKQFYVPQSRINSSKYCSRDCQNHRFEKHKFDCLECGKNCVTSFSYRRTKKYCSHECANKAKINDKMRRQKSKATSVLKRGNNSSRKLRSAIFKLKEKTCQICGYNEFDFCLDLHHIDNDCNNNTVENVAILCVICHRKLHKGIIKM